MADEHELCTVVRKQTTTIPPPCSNTPGDAPDTPTKPRALIVETSPNPPQTRLGLQEPPLRPRPHPSTSHPCSRQAGLPRSQVFSSGKWRA